MKKFEFHWVLEENILHILEIFSTKKVTARIIGGAVRDFLLGKKNIDIDIATILIPEEIIKIAKKFHYKINIIGAKFGTIILYLENDQKIEITSLRKDLSSDGRHSIVEFGASWEEDAARRDFTINSLSYDFKEKKIYDYFSGFEDLLNKKIRFIGDPLKRIEEDHLRILRFFRFNNLYGKNNWDENILNLIKEKNYLIKNLSSERITEEMLKIFACYDIGPILHKMNESMLLKIIFGKIIEIPDQLLENLEIIESKIGQNIWRKLFLILDKNNLLIEKLAKNWKLTKNSAKILENYNKYKEIDQKDYKKNLLELLYFYGKDLVYEILIIYFSERNLIKLEKIQYLKDELDNIKIVKLPLSGSEISEYTKCKNHEIKFLLEKLQKEWINSNFTLTKEYLLQKSVTYLKN